MKIPVYLDNHATTPLDPRVLDAMMPYLTEHFGNANSNHVFGWIAKEAVDISREKVAGILNAFPEEIFFTSGATESNNLALKGVVRAAGISGGHIISLKTEHKAVLDPLDNLQTEGFTVTLLDVDQDGFLDLEELSKAITEKTILVSVMLANNEIGVIQDISAVSQICRQSGVLLHSDASQAVGKIPVDVEKMGIDLLSFSGHKIYGPKGIGGLFIRKTRPRIKISPLVEGGGHERGIRPGTLNTPAIVGLGVACEIASAEMPEESKRMALLRDRLRQLLWDGLDNIFENGAKQPKLPGNLNVSFAGIEGESLLMGLNDVAVSSSSACTSGTIAPSHVLTALGLRDYLAKAAIRFGIGRFNTLDEIEYAANKIIREVKRLRGFAN